jgi:hypothetical protein
VIARPGPAPALLAFGTPWDDLLAQMVLGDRNFLQRLKGMKNTVIKGNAKDQPSYRMIQSVEPETLLKQAADYFRLTEAELTRKSAGSTGKNEH